MKLTDHFTLAEFEHSQTADRFGIDNTAPGFVLPNIRATAHGLEMIRTLVECPLVVSSGYRCLELNTAIGSKPTSQHVLGQAADITAPAYGPAITLMSAIFMRRDLIQYDQLLLEFVDKGKPNSGWVHVSFTSTPRVQALVINREGTHAYA